MLGVDEVKSKEGFGIESLGPIVSIDHHPYGITGQTTNANFKITFFNAETVRVQLSTKSSFLELPYALIAKPGLTDWKMEDTGSTLLLSTESIRLELTKDPMRIALKDSSSYTLIEDEPEFGTSWIENEITTYKKIRDGERFIGLGEKTGHLDRRNSGFVNWNTDAFRYTDKDDPLYSSIPFYMGVVDGRSYGVFLNNSSRTTFNFGASNNRFSSFSVESGDMDYFLFGGSTAQQIIQDYSWLTGTMPLPPKWSLGYQQCRYSYYPDSEVLQIAKKFRAKKIPADVIYLDIHYMDKYKIFTWDNHRFPSPSEMIKDLKEMGFKVIVIIDPGVKIEGNYEIYEGGKRQNAFLTYPDGSAYSGEVWPGWCHFPDFTDPETRRWWSACFKDYLEKGVRGYWNDMNEISTWGQCLPSNIIFDFDGEATTTAQGRNVYGLEMARSTYEGVSLSAGCQQRPFVLSRSGFSGIQRYSALWTGDNTPTDNHMLLGIRLVSSLGLSGVSFSGYDVGGFTGDCDAALYIRWMTIGAFSPLFRGHTMINTRSSEPWAYGEEAEEICRNYISFRYQLMPYLYSCFWESSQTGMPVQRSLSIDYTCDDRIYKEEYENQYLFGPSLLIAPVDSRQQIAKVYLPQGMWHHLHDGSCHRGSQVVRVDAPLDQLPVFIKGSSIIPMQSPVEYVEQRHNGFLHLHVFYGEEDNTFTWYDDDGDTYNYTEGSFFKRTINYLPERKEIQLSEVDGNYSSAFSKIKLHLHGFVGLQKISINHEVRGLIEEEMRWFKGGSPADPAIGPKETVALKVKTAIFKHITDQIIISWK